MLQTYPTFSTINSALREKYITYEEASELKYRIKLYYKHLLYLYHRQKSTSK